MTAIRDRSASLATDWPIDLFAATQAIRFESAESEAGRWLQSNGQRKTVRYDSVSRSRAPNPHLAAKTAISRADQCSRRAALFKDAALPPGIVCAQVLPRNKRDLLRRVAFGGVQESREGR